MTCRTPVLASLVALAGLALGGLSPALAGPGTSTPPTGVASSYVGPSVVCVFVIVTFGTSPVSTGVTVVANLSAVGGPPSAVLVDDGTNGDAVAGDNIFTYCFSPGAPPAGCNTLSYIVSDAQGRASTGGVGVPPTASCPPASGPTSSALLDISGPANNTPWACRVYIDCCFDLYIPSVAGVAPSGTQSTDEAALRDQFVNALNAACPGIATALPYNGTTVLTYGQFSITAGNCLLGTPLTLAVGPANTPKSGLCITTSPSTSGTCSFNPSIRALPLWGADCNANDIDDRIDVLTGAAADANGNHILDQCEPACSLADLTELGGTAEAPGSPDGQLTVDDIIVFFNAFSDAIGCPGVPGFACNLADVTGIGGPPEPADGQLTVDDVIAFFNAFADGC